MVPNNNINININDDDVISPYVIIIDNYYLIIIITGEGQSHSYTFGIVRLFLKLSNHVHSLYWYTLKYMW